MNDRLHLGAGNDIRPGFVNHDGAALPGVDVVHDLRAFPWPFPADQFVEVVAWNLLEHLPDTVATMEELHRICRDGARVELRVPYWNSPDMITDPTHVRAFNQHVFDFFDPERRHCKERPYYSRARFRIARLDYFVRWRGDYKLVRAPWAKRWLERLATHFGGVIWVMEAELIALKPRGA